MKRNIFITLGGIYSVFALPQWRNNLWLDEER
jgi:hypothetical protein